MKFLPAKTEALEKFQEFVAEHKISNFLRSDKDKEFTSTQFQRSCI